MPLLGNPGDTDVASVGQKWAWRKGFTQWKQNTPMAPGLQVVVSTSLRSTCPLLSSFSRLLPRPG
ncbi:hypothetical protein E2C01_080741 [Portunus trituberculatus]|uniref:Uncharacterized protein n=1 Tax=Portunus trituberculatus TaxID=210409 RepID=A0A5B7IU02_PORTR|nr:hypothetical protein [Portunus trituberculatus]